MTTEFPATSKDAPATSKDAPATPGVLLAGGLARRMGGGDKPTRQIAGRTILERVIARLKPQCDGLILNANGDPARFAAFGLPVIADTVADFPGPLAGILAALDWVATDRPGISWVLSAAADCPFLPRDLVARLHRARAEENAQLAVAAKCEVNRFRVRREAIDGNLWAAIAAIRLREELSSKRVALYACVTVKPASACSLNFAPLKMPSGRIVLPSNSG